VSVARPDTDSASSAVAAGAVTATQLAETALLQLTSPKDTPGGQDSTSTLTRPVPSGWVAVISSSKVSSTWEPPQGCTSVPLPSPRSCCAKTSRPSLLPRNTKAAPSSGSPAA
jgi:hypothetical protein